MLAPDTLAAIEELFRWRSCRKCHKAAERLRKGRFYCALCFELLSEHAAYYEPRRVRVNLEKR